MSDSQPFTDYTFHLLYKKLAAKFKPETVSRHWDKCVKIARRKRNAMLKARAEAPGNGQEKK